MSANDWRREMNEMLTAIDRQATVSLRKIKRCFELSGGSMDEDFRMEFLRKSNQRLEASYANVKRELNKDQGRNGNSECQASDRGFVQETLVNDRNAGNTSTNDLNLQSNQNGSTSNANSFNLVVKNEPQSSDFGATENEKANGQDGVIEIIDWNDEEQDGNEIRVKEEPRVEVKLEPIEEEIPMRRFMASEVYSNNPSNSIDNDANLNGTESHLESRLQQKNSESNALKPSGSKEAKKFKCQQCEYAAAFKCDFNRHMLKHTGEKPFRCDQCCKRFKWNNSLKRHMTTHKDVFQFHCAGCFLGFYQEIEKKDHEKSCGRRRYECHVCKEFTTGNKTDLERHMRIHTGERPFRCNRCTKSYQELQHLRMHMATHKDRKLPFYCIGCLRRFANKDQKLTHENECRNRRYECHLCKAFVTTKTSHLKSHMRSHHTGEKPFRCELCMKWFTEKCNLNKHFNTIHNRK